MMDTTAEVEINGTAGNPARWHVKVISALIQPGNDM